MCTSSPITGTSFDPSSCVQIFSNPAGQRVNLANQANQGESIRLGSFELIPGQYTHFYVVISNRFGIKGEYTMTDAGTWYTDGRDPDDAPGFNNAKAASPAIAFENLISNFGGGDNDPCKTVDAFSLEGGNIETLLVNEALQVTCQGSSKIVASFIPSTPLAIPEISPESAPRIDVAFTITNNGLVVLPNDPPAPGILGFGGGGFFPQFRLLN